MAGNGHAEIEAAKAAMLDRIGDAVAEDARRLAPVDTGELRGSIRVERTGDGLKIVATSDHAAYVELGTSHQAAQPYLRPALYRRREV